MGPLERLEIQTHRERMEFVIPLIHNKNKTPFCISSNKLFLKYGIQDNHWVGQLVMKPVDAV